MKRNRSRIQPFFLLLILCLLIVTGHIVLAAEATVPDHEPAAVDAIAWAENVRDNKVGASVGANFSNPAAALGEEDAVPGQSGIYSLGNALADSPQPPLLPSQCEAYLIVDFGKNAIVDGDGNDIGVFEVAATGVAEATWVYIGKDVEDSEEWLYAGKTGGSIEGIDISGVGDPGEQFNLVALCDFPDGYSSGWPVGGPDIDAIAALNFTRTGLTAAPDGPGWSKNDEPLPEGQDAPLDPGDDIKFNCPDGASNRECSGSGLDIKIQCPEGNNEPLFGLAITFADRGTPEYWMLIKELLDEVKAACAEGSANNLAAQGPMATFAIQEGRFGFIVEKEIWRFELQTSTAVVYSAGPNNFSITHDPERDESIISVSTGSVLVDPSAAGEEPFTLNAGQQVSVDAGGSGPVVDLALVYLPVTSRTKP